MIKENKKPLMQKDKLLMAILPVFCLFFSASVHAQTYSLQQVLDSIVSRNPGLKQFELQARASDMLARSAKAWEAPQAGAGLSEFPYPSEGKQNPQMAPPRKMIMLRVQQMFPDFKEQRSEQQYYQSFASQYLDDQSTVQNDLFARAKESYYDAFIAEKKLSVIDQQVKQLQLLIQIAQGRLAYNKASLSNIYKAKAALSDLQSQRINLNSQVLQDASVMNSLMERPADAALLTDTSAYYEQKQVDILGIDSAYLLSNRSDIKLVSDEIHSLSLKRETISAKSRPHFGVTWDNMRMNSGMYMYNIMGMVTIPIAPWFSKGYKSEVQSINYQISSMKDMQQDRIDQALGNVRKDWLMLEAAKKDLQIFETEVIPAFAKTYQANLDAYSENTGDIYETLMAWNDLTQKKMECYDKLGALFRIKIRLETELQQY